MKPGKLQALLQKLQIEEFDYIIFGDGSGCKHDAPCGWGAVSIARTGQVRKWAGGASSGSINFAELMAFIQPLTGILAQILHGRGHNGHVRIIRVVCVTDSKYAHDLGQKRIGPKKNRILWRILQELTSQGFVIDWRWIRRLSMPFNKTADKLAYQARLRQGTLVQ